MSIALLTKASRLRCGQNAMQRSVGEEWGGGGV